MSCLHSSSSTEVPIFEVTWGLSTGLQCASDLDNLYLDVLDSHVWQSSGGALKCLFWYTDDGFGVLDSRKITVHELQCLLKGWNASIKVPSVETGSPLPFLDVVLEKRVLDENNRKFGVKFSTFRKKLNIYYVPGDSDHHPCMMQSTIRGKLTRLLRTNSSVDSFEQEIKFFRLKLTWRGHDGKEVRSNRKELPVARQENACPKKVKPKPFVFTTFQESALVPFFEESSTSM